MSASRPLSLTLAALLAAGCVSASAPAPGSGRGALNAAIDRWAGPAQAAVPSLEYVLDAPDVISIEVHGEPDLGSPAVALGPDGRIHRPLVGPVEVGGRTVSEVTSELRRRYARYIRDVEVTVTVVEFRSKHVFVTGEVRHPGRYAYTGADHVLDVIAQAGFLTRQADPDAIHVARPAHGYTESLPVRLDDIVERGDARTNWRLRPDDVIHVPPGLLARVAYAVHDVLAPVAIPVRVHSDD